MSYIQQPMAYALAVVSYCTCSAAAAIIYNNNNNQQPRHSAKTKHIRKMLKIMHN